MHAINELRLKYKIIYSIIYLWYIVVKFLVLHVQGDGSPIFGSRTWIFTGTGHIETGKADLGCLNFVLLLADSENIREYI